jgi:RND family efflux transporter MFP subunit
MARSIWSSPVSWLNGRIHRRVGAVPTDAMTTSPPNVSDLRINREDPPAASGGHGRLWTFVILGAIAIAVAVWALRAPRAIPVQIATVSVSGGAGAGGAGAGGAGISANGYVVARTKASVSAKIAGRMEYLSVHEGSRVRRGEVIARIESSVYQAALQAAKAQVGEVQAQLVQARRDYERAKKLRDQDLISTADLENSQTKVDVLVASLNTALAQQKLAAANLENTVVRAPFDGTVLRKDAEVGEIVAPASAGGGLTRTSIVTMADLSTLEVEVDVNEAYIAQVHNGEDARITLDAYSDTSFTGRVRQVVPTADRQKATVLVKVSILDHDPRILPEMGAKVVFVTAANNPVAAAPVRVTVPVAAVVRAGGAAKVWVVERDRVAARPIEIGREDEDRIEVRSGLAGGESVVLAPPPGLAEGARVRATK